MIVALLSLIGEAHPPGRAQADAARDARRAAATCASEPAIVALTVLAFLTTFLGAAAADVPAGLRARRLPGRRRPLQPDDGVLRRRRVVGALVVAWLGRFKHMGRTLLLVQLVFGALVTAFALSRDLAG